MPKKPKYPIPSTATGRKRLMKLHDLLMADAKNKDGVRFDFTRWGSVADPDKPMSCGTSACAVGLAAISGAFKRAGLVWDNSAEYLGYGAGFGYKIRMTSGTRGGVPSAAELFRISGVEASWLFTSTDGLDSVEGAKAERAVAFRIARFVAGQQRPS